MFYSKSAGGFYITEIHGSNMPADVVEITVEYHAELINGQSIGKVITANEDGYPILVDPAPVKETVEQVLLKRQHAYTKESDHLKLEAEYDAIVNKLKKPDYSKWLNKVAEIKERFPLPSEG